MIENIRIFERTDCWGATWYWTNKDDCWSQFACVDEKATDKMFFDANSATLMFSAALKAAEIIEIFEAELKKN